MKTVYEIWLVQHNKTKPCPSIYLKVEFDQNKQTWAIPIVEILGSYPRFSRSDVISVDLFKLEENCKYLNEIADSDEHFEIRERQEEIF